MAIEDFEVGLGRRTANFAPLTPLVFLDWSADVYPEHLAVVHGARRYSWSETRDRCRRLASALAARGIGRGDTVAVLLANTPEMIEAHFGVPMTGAVLIPLNTRLDAAAIAFMLEHGEAKVLLVDRDFSGLAAWRRGRAGPAPARGGRRRPRVRRPGRADRHPGVRVAARVRATPATPGRAARRRVAGHLAELHLRHHRQPQGRRRTTTAALTSTPSGTSSPGTCRGTRVPVDAADVPLQRVVLPLDVAASPAPNVCLRKVEAAAIFAADRASTASPTTAARRSSTTCSSTPRAELRAGIDHRRPRGRGARRRRRRRSRATERLGFDLTHVYGLTETYGPAAVCAKHDEWAALDAAGPRPSGTGARACATRSRRG